MNTTAHEMTRTSPNLVDRLLSRHVLTHDSASLDCSMSIDAESTDGVWVGLGTGRGTPSSRDPFAAENTKARLLLGYHVGPPYSAKLMRAVLASSR